jgi:hypothetical protein
MEALKKPLEADQAEVIFAGVFLALRPSCSSI